MGRAARDRAKAVERLKRKGIKADGHVLGTRNATKKILAEAAAEGCDAIVMAADPDRNRSAGNFMWTQEPQRVRRKAKLPVFLVPDEDEPPRRALADAYWALPAARAGGPA